MKRLFKLGLPTFFSAILLTVVVSIVVYLLVLPLRELVTQAFASPSLEAGKQFYYMFEGELVRDGRTVTTSKKVEVRAGEQIQVQLDFPL